MIVTGSNVAAHRLNYTEFARISEDDYWPLFDKHGWPCPRHLGCACGRGREADGHDALTTVLITGLAPARGARPPTSLKPSPTGAMPCSLTPI